MDFGYVIKFNDNQFNVFVDLNNYYSGYGVVPKTEDLNNLYDIDEVRAYCSANPSKVLTKHPLEDKIMYQMEIDSLKGYLNKTDYIVIKCQELNLSIQDTYPETSKQRIKARERINFLEQEILKNELD